MAFLCVLLLLQFQSTPLREGRLPKRHWCPLFYGVSIHAPARGATCLSTNHEEKPLVSIHAPARGATRGRREDGHSGPVSIHAPARGATGEFVKAEDIDKFQSTPLREGRPITPLLSFRRMRVSIHAPARGATWCRQSPPCRQGFQSTPLREGRPEGRLIPHTQNWFQSTPLREGRLDNSVSIEYFARFNPRPCARGDFAFA